MLPEDMRASSPDFPTTCEIHGCGTISCEKVAGQIFMTVFSSTQQTEEVMDHVNIFELTTTKHSLICTSFLF